jgi:EmrB/QacA subfamily drug resistance transporter
MFVIGLAGFGVTSLICGLAPNMELLILARLAQGAFGALLVPTSLALINAGFEGAERGRAFGIWAAATSALVVGGPVVGGFLVDTFGWRVAFLVNVPLVAVGVAIALAFLVESRNEQASGHFDWLGAAVVALAVGGLSYGAIRGQEQQWTDATAWAGLAIGSLATVSVVPLMLLRRDPLVPPSLFQSRNFTITNVSTLLIYGALYALSYFLAVYLQGTLDYTALASGLSAAPTGFALAFLSTTFGQLAGRYGPRRFMAIGPALMALGLLWYVRIPADSEAWRASFTDSPSLLPPGSFFVDVLPSACSSGLASPFWSRR